MVVTDETGIHVDPPERPRDSGGAFGFMQGGVSSERPSESLIEEVAEAVEETKSQGGKVLVVAGPALIHAGAGDDLARLVREGYVDMISAGNGFAVARHRARFYGTSLGMDMERWNTHEKATNTTSTPSARSSARAASRRPSSPEPSSRRHVRVYRQRPTVRTCDSIRDDGPLPDTITDAVEARTQSESRPTSRHRLMLSTLLTRLPSGTVSPRQRGSSASISISATVTQLLDRGSAQAVGMVTDIGSFVPLLAEQLLSED